MHMGTVVSSSATPWTVAAGFFCPWDFPRQEYYSWSALPFPTPGALPISEIEPTSLKSLALAGILYYCISWEAYVII